MIPTVPQALYHENGGLHEGGPRHRYVVNTGDRFAVRWGDFDMYICDSSPYDAVLTIVTKPSQDRYDRVLRTRHLSFNILRSSTWAEWEDGSILANTLIGGNGRQRDHASCVTQAKHAVRAYNRFLELGGVISPDTGDALCRLNTNRRT